jgi:hypothetical protein
MKRIDFFRLERPVQERFVDASLGQGMPTPLLVGSAPLPLSAIGWAALSALLVVLWIWVIRLGYGKLDSSLALQPPAFLILHLSLPALAVLAGFRGRSSLRARWRLPFPPKVYLFPIGVVDARTAAIAVYGWDDLESVRVRGSSVRVSFRGGSFTFPLAEPQQGAELERRIQEYKQQLAGGQLSDHDLVLLDPLRDNGFRNPFSPAESMRPPKPKRLPLWPIAAALGAIGLGVGVWAIRNSLGEHAIYAEARQRDSADAYRAYVARGGTQREVSELLLPRAELRAAIAAGNVEAIEGYLSSHPHSKIASEVQTALRVALLRALEEAKQKNTITAFREYESRYAKHLALVPELAQARFAYLSSVLDRFHSEFKPTRELWQLARRLIVYADKHGPDVFVRFAQRDARIVEKNERQLMMNGYYSGERSLPRHYLQGPPVRAAEERAGKDLCAALGKLFPPDLVRFSVGPALPGSATPDFNEPTLLVSYRLEISGVFVSKKPRAVYGGVGWLGEASFSVPDKEPAYVFKHQAWHVPDTHRIEAEDLKPEKVYTELVDKAFARLITKYMAPWLGKGS